jgi:hypothetical protein
LQGRCEIQLDILGSNTHHSSLESFVNVEIWKNLKRSLYLILQDFWGAKCNKNNKDGKTLYQNPFEPNFKDQQAACLTGLFNCNISLLNLKYNVLGRLYSFHINHSVCNYQILAL